MPIKSSSVARQTKSLKIKEEEQLLYITYVCVCIGVSEERNIGPKINAHIHNILLFV